MGRKSTYFRHIFSAHNDPKMMRLLDIGGLKTVGAYWIIVELYGASFINDDEQNITQELNVRHIANALGLRSDSCRTVIGLLSDCKLIEAVWCKSDISSVQVGIPKFMKYFGKYSKTEAMKCPNKKKRKEKKRKESKVAATDFFLDHITQDEKNWLNGFDNNSIGASQKLQEKWISDYGIEKTATRIRSAYEWTLANPDKPRKTIGKFLSVFFKDDMPSNELKVKEERLRYLMEK